MTQITPTNPTLADVAKAAGVSTASISRALNDPDKVAKATRDKITAAIDALGYTPNFGARALASSRTNTIGAVIPTMANAMFASGVQAFQEVLSEHGVTLLIASTNYDPNEELRQIKSLVSHGATGLLLVGNARLPETDAYLKSRRIAHVTAWCHGDAPGFVGFDNRKAARLIVDAVLAEGHRRIAMISGALDGNDRAAARVAGVQDGLATVGITQMPLAEVPYRLEHGGDAFEALMNGHAPTAVICGNDVLAAGALARARAMGLDVPGDVSVTGFDDIGLASVVTPGLTTIRVPQIEMGRLAAEHLLAAVDGNIRPSMELPTQLIRRGSLGPAPDSAR